MNEESTTDARTFNEAKMSDPIQTTDEALLPPEPNQLTIPKLPAELRHKIWKCTLPGPRYIEFVSMYEAGDYPVSYPQCKDRKPPIALHICRESRTEALREYKELRGSCTGCPPMYYSPKVDIICFANGRIVNDLHWLLTDIYDQHKEGVIKRLAIQDWNRADLEISADDDGCGAWDWLLALGLDELFLVTSDKDIHWDSRGIVGFKDGWTTESEDFAGLNNMVQYCQDVQEKAGTVNWKAPVIRTGTWVFASDWKHNTNWLTRAFTIYGEGVRDGTIERREHDTENWNY
jgi:hypothetical protein